MQERRFFSLFFPCGGRADVWEMVVSVRSFVQTCHTYGGGGMRELRKDMRDMGACLMCA